ncbi:hydrogenase formation protein HypD [Pseudaeromonas sp. ZJS20]|uniref:hydrogenase formation protein HypD n=1 Tax=Pseudaeromonas aegiceratis TaxID=3153928 RepID=UPI00390C50C1
MIDYRQDFRRPAGIRALLSAIERQLAAMPTPSRPWQLMEICGGHTHAIFRHGLDRLLPDCIEFLHGPGCPVCVLPVEIIDQAVSLARRPDVILCSYGDALRVPGSQGSLLAARAAGADVRVIYAPLDLLALARRHPNAKVVLLAIGFETTTPATAALLEVARAQGIDNLRVLVHHLMMGPPLRALLADGGCRVDGFIGPGHVSLVTGQAPFDFIPREFGLPVVISGFEPTDLLASVLMLLRQLAQGRAEVSIQYRRAATEAGNRAAQALIQRVFEPAPSTAWRGLGELPGSGWQLNPAYAAFDARALLGGGAGPAAPPPAGCGCDAVLKGQIKPADCPLFGRACRPASPVGALMVSAEGACAAWYHYRHEERQDG